MIDVFNKKITLRVGNEEVIFDVDQSIKRPPVEDDECYGIDYLDTTIHLKTQELLEDNQLDLILVNNPEESIDQSDIESCSKAIDGSKSEISIWRIKQVSTPYSESRETQGPERTQNEHLYSASANEIDGKKIPKLKDLPSHLEYAYLKGNKSCPVIISSKQIEKEKKITFAGIGKTQGSNLLEDVRHKGNKSVILQTQDLNRGKLQTCYSTPQRLNLKVQDVVKNEIVRVHPNSNRTRGSREFNIYLSLWNFCLQEDAVWIMQCSNNFSKMNDSNIP
ncbi:hypothetical protein Tco_0305200 [Tanacetum coccineum]